MGLDTYNVTITLKKDMLATNPLDPNILDKHIIQKQRQMIMEKSQVNSQVNKYLDALDISEERSEVEKECLIAKLEELSGQPVSPEDRALIAAGKLEELKERFVDVEMKGTTVFYTHPDEKMPCIGSHMILGFLKAAGEAIARTKPRKNATMLQSASYTSSIINQHCGVEQELIVFDQDIMRDEKGNPEYNERPLRAKTAQGERISLTRSEVVPAGAKLTFELCVMENSPLTEAVLRELFDYGALKGLGQWRNTGYGKFTYELEKAK